MQEVKYLGQQHSSPIEVLDVMPTSAKGMVIKLDCSEFTSHCPVTKQPDFARIVITYIADENIVETKSLKLWLWRWREVADFNEKIVADIARMFFEQVRPVAVRVDGSFNARGGISVSPSMSLGDWGHQ